MLDEFTIDELVPVATALSGLTIRAGKPVSQSTRQRWIAGGLQTVLLGTTRMTTRRWVEEYIRERTRQRAGVNPVTRRKPSVNDVTVRLERASN